MQEAISYASSTLKKGVTSLSNQVRGTPAAGSETAAGSGLATASKQIKFCKFSQLYARDLLEMINTSQSLNLNKQEQ